MRAALLLMLSGVVALLSLPAHAVSVEKTRAMSDADILKLLEKGEFSANKYGGVSQDARRMLCEWVEADRRDVVTRIVKAQTPQAVSWYPLLACAPTEEAYRYWKALGASSGRLGVPQPMRQGYDEKWGYDYDQRSTSLAVAAGNFNAASVAAHLADGVDVGERSGALHTAFGAALIAWEWTVRPIAGRRPKGGVEDIAERDGFGAGVTVSLDDWAPPDSRRRRQDVAAAAQVVRLLLEAGASLDDLSRAGYMAAHQHGYYRVWRKPGHTYRMQYATDERLGPTLPLLLEAERYAQEIRGPAAACRNWDEEACKQVLAKADPLSPNRASADRQLAALEKKRADWNARVAAQRCRMNLDGWAYTGTACAGGKAHGVGSAVRWWTGETFTGEFRDGGFAAGKLGGADGQPVFDGRFNPDGSYASGKLFENGRPVYEGSFTGNGTPHGTGICWVQGAPEECRYHEGQRIDSLHKQRLENEKLRKDLAEQARQKAEQQRRVAEEHARRAREEAEEERKEQRNAAALAAGMAAMRGDYSAAAAAGMPGAETLVTMQKAMQQESRMMEELRQPRPQPDVARSAPSSLPDSSQAAALPAAAAPPADYDALADKKMEYFECHWFTVSQPGGEQPIAQGVCREADLAAHRVQCRPDWEGLPETRALYKCAAENSTGRFRKKYADYYQALERAVSR